MIRFLLFVLLALPSASWAAPPDEHESAGTRSATLLAGVGHSLGWLGVQGEKHFHNDRLSVFAGVGLGLQKERPASGVALAGGMRAYGAGTQGRRFVELSVSKIGDWSSPQGAPTESRAQVYGPGLQVGYQRISRGGFTLVLSLGVGYAVTSRPINSHVQALVGIGLGFTWHRSLLARP